MRARLFATSWPAAVPIGLRGVSIEFVEERVELAVGGGLEHAVQHATHGLRPDVGTFRIAVALEQRFEEKSRAFARSDQGVCREGECLADAGNG